MKVKAALMISITVLVLIIPVLFFPASGVSQEDNDSSSYNDDRELYGQIRFSRERRKWEEREDYYPIYEDGKDLFYEGKYAKAKRKFERVLDISEWNRGANRYLGRIYLKEGNYSKAIKYLEDCLKETSGGYRRQALYYLAKAYEGANYLQKALYIWKEYVRRLTPPADARQKRWLGQARERIRSLRAQLKSGPSR